MAYYKDSPYAQQTLFPRMVSSVRAPLLPDGYQGNDTGYYGATGDTNDWMSYLSNPWVIGITILIIVLVIWFAMK